METGAFFLHCDTKCTPPLDVRIMSVYSQGCLNHILCSCMLVVLVFSLASQFCQTSLWIVSLEEETSVNLHNLMQVLSKFNERQVSGRLQLLLLQKSSSCFMVYCGILAAIIVIYGSGKLKEHVIGWGSEHKSCHWDWTCKISSSKQLSSFTHICFLSQMSFSLCGHTALEMLYATLTSDIQSSADAREPSGINPLINCFLIVWNVTGTIFPLEI